MQRVEELIDKGCYTQVNSNHVLKPALIGDRAKEFKNALGIFRAGFSTLCCQ